MRKLLLYLLVLSCLFAEGQVVTADDFVTISSLPEKKMGDYVSKKGFVQTARNYDNDTVTNEYFYNNRKKGNETPDSVLRFISGYVKGKATGVIYKTSSAKEYESIINDFEKNGFLSGKEGKDSLLFFQKGNMTVHIDEVTEDDVKFYLVRVDRKPLPDLSNIRFADDLLAFDSHESLSMLFGKENVKKDAYYFSATQVNRCSVLYPNTNRQAIFIWEDQQNSRKLSFLLIGGSLRSESSSDFNQTIGLNSWHSHSGLYTGMKLSEVETVNDGDFYFYGLNSEFAFMAVPEKKGNIDFKKTGIVLGCFNCNAEPVLKTEKVSAEAAINAGLRLYIMSIVLIP